MEERRDVTLWVVLGILLGAVVAFWLAQKDEEKRHKMMERAQRLRDQAIELQTVTIGRTQEATSKAQEKAMALQAEVSAEVERRLREGRETLDEMINQVREEVRELQARAQKAAGDARLQAQLMRKRAELRALEARKRLRDLRA